ncbi:hypothetical protein Tco_0623362 [Tanacetum coccineum]
MTNNSFPGDPRYNEEMNHQHVNASLELIGFNQNLKPRGIVGCSECTYQDFKNVNQHVLKEPKVWLVILISVEVRRMETEVCTISNCLRKSSEVCLPVPYSIVALTLCELSQDNHRRLNADWGIRFVKERAD